MTRREALEILGLEADASLDEARQAYRELSRRYHPDKNPASNATVMFRYIHEAWEYIQNDAKTSQKAKGTQKQAEETWRAETENAQQQGETKNSNPDENDTDASGAWIALGCVGVWFLLIFVIGLIVGVIESCQTDDKPVRTASKPADKLPHKSVGYIDRGKAKADKGEYFEAISDYDMAISLNPDFASAYHYRGKAKAKLGRHIDAIVDYDTAISLKPDDSSAYNSRGWAKYRLGRHAAAIADFDIAISLDPDAAYLYCNRGRVKLDWKQHVAAIADLDTAVRLAPADTRFYTWRGWAKYKDGRHFAAITDYDTAIRLDKNKARAYYYRGLAKKEIGGDKGAEDFKKALELAEKAGDRDLQRAIKQNMPY